MRIKLPLLLLFLLPLASIGLVTGCSSNFSPSAPPLPGANTSTPTFTKTSTPGSPTITPVLSGSPTPNQTLTTSPSPNLTNTNTTTQTPTNTPTNSPTNTPTSTLTGSPSPIWTNTNTITATATTCQTPTWTWTPTSSITPGITSTVCSPVHVSPTVTETCAVPFFGSTYPQDIYYENTLTSPGCNPGCGSAVYYDVTGTQYNICGTISSTANGNPTLAGADWHYYHYNFSDLLEPGNAYISCPGSATFAIIYNPCSSSPTTTFGNNISNGWGDNSTIAIVGYSGTPGPYLLTFWAQGTPTSSYTPTVTITPTHSSTSTPTSTPTP